MKSAFQLEVTGRVPAESAGNAYVAAIFLSGTEISREAVTPAPIAGPLTGLTTDSAGTASLTGSAVGPGRYRLRLEYAGDLGHWPARFEQEIVVQ